MKLRNKKTGEIGYLYEHSLSQDIIIVYDVNGIVGKYKSISELCDDWEDYKEPKEYWYLDAEGTITCDSNDETPYDNFRKQIGNYFETIEEAEKAVEKLKAWKRLKDKGIEFYGWRKNHTGTYDFLARWKEVPPKMHKIIDDLDLLFGGEE